MFFLYVRITHPTWLSITARSRTLSTFGFRSPLRRLAEVFQSNWSGWIPSGSSRREPGSAVSRSSRQHEYIGHEEDAVPAENERAERVREHHGSDVEAPTGDVRPEHEVRNRVHDDDARRRKSRYATSVDWPSSTTGSAVMPASGSVYTARPGSARDTDQRAGKRWLGTSTAAGATTL